MYAAPTPAGTIDAKSASSSSTLGDFPPSSSATFLMVGAASSDTRRPARVEPVKEIMSTSGCAASASPTTGPVPVTRLNTPGGNPRSSKISASRNALTGATSDGLSTTVQPAASAYATLAPIWFSG